MTDRSEKDAARDAAMQRHFVVTGEVVWEWNALHRTLGYIFMSLLDDRQTHVSNALWLTPGSDKAQRDLLKTAVDWADGLRGYPTGLQEAAILKALRKQLREGILGQETFSGRDLDRCVYVVRMTGSVVIA